MRARSQLLSVALLSASLVAFEVTLLRVFSISLWYHFAYLILSVAMLGLGASGTLLSIVQPRPGAADRLFAPLALGTAVAELGGLAAALQVSFEPFMIVWAPKEALWLMAFYFFLGVPFGLGGAALGLALIGWRRVGIIYFSDLMGGGLGALSTTLLLFWLEPLQVVGPVAIAAALAATVAASRKRLALLSLLAALIAPVAASLIPQKSSPYKGLATALTAVGSERRAHAISPLAVVDAVAGPTVRYAPGLSLEFAGDIPPQIGLFADGDQLGSITQAKDSDLTFLDYMTSALPYRLAPPDPSVLVLGAGGGIEVLSALHHGARRVVAVELDENVANMVGDVLREHSGALYDHPAVEVRLAEARRFIETGSERFDVISISLLDSFASSASGVQAASESYLYTVEALDAALGRLSPTGVLALTRWVKTPPRDVPRVFHTAVAALESRGVSSPGDHLVGIRSWATATLLVTASPVSVANAETVREFSEARSFDRFWHPGLTPEDTNRHHVLPEPFYAHSAREILSPRRSDFLRDYPFQLEPAVDDRPYFFNFFRWDTLPSLVAEMGLQWIPFVEWGYVILLAVLAQATVASIGLVLAPLILVPDFRRPEYGRSKVALYFGCLGLGYLFLEIALIQKFTLFLSYPVLSATTVIASMLVFSGLGSLVSHRFPLSAVAAGIAILAFIYALALNPVLSILLEVRDAARVLIATILLAPIAFLMGMPFPCGLEQVKTKAAPLAPWAWAVNGCASVLAPPLATLLAMSFGFRAVMVSAAALYLLAGLLVDPGKVLHARAEFPD